RHAPVVGLLDEIGQHLFGDFEVRDDTVLHRLDGDNVARRASEHLFCLAADSYDFTARLVDGHYRGLVDDNAFAVREHQCVGSAQIDGEVGRKQTEYRPHVVTVLVHPPSPCGERLSAVRPAIALASRRPAPNSYCLRTLDQRKGAWVFLRKSYFGTTMDTCFIAVPPRRFDPMIEIVC